MNAIMPRQIPSAAQGELLVGIASLYSISAIIGPPLMTQLFGYFSSDQAPIFFPGAGFLCAALLAAGGALLFLRASRPAAEPLATTAAPAATPEAPSL